MWIKNITIQNCRSIDSLNLNLSKDLNVIIGPNASGKTSLLEALNILSKGRSFRTSHIDEVISSKASSVVVTANIIDQVNNEFITSRVGIDKNKSKTKIRIDKKDIFTQAELSALLPVTVIHPSSVELITGSPASRRSFLDWIAFYIFPEFHSKWKKYQHVLKQRNICLKFKKHEYALSTWTNELVELQPDLIQYRQSVISLLQPLVTSIAEKLLPSINVELELKTGFPKDIKTHKDELLSFYNSKLESDLKLKRTSFGAHRSDFSILFNSIPATECASRGQLKILAICLLLAQSNCISKTQIGSGVLLIDDLAAELDSSNKALLLNYLSTLDKQLIITSTDEIQLSSISPKVFHVKHGSITEK